MKSSLWKEDRSLFVDPCSGETLSFREIGLGLQKPTVDFLPMVQPSTPRKAIRAVVEAILLGQPLTLLDPDLSAEELEATYGGSEQPERVRCAGIDWDRDGDLFPECFAGKPGFSLTLFTSGSTGLPRQVTHTLDSLSRMVKRSAAHAQSIWGLAYNPCHIAGVQVLLQAMANGNPVILLYGLDSVMAADAIREQGVTHLSATPSYYRMLFRPGETFPGVRAVTVGGEPSTAKLFARLKQMFPAARCRNLYASTEAGTLLEAEEEWFRIPDNLAAKVAIRGQQLWVHQSLLGGLIQDRSCLSEGWYNTGDRVDFCPGNKRYFRLVGRDGEWVNVGGEKVNPREVEEVLETHPGIHECRVRGQPNSVLGQVLVADCVASGDPPPTSPELKKFLASHFSRYKIPHMFRWTQSLPRSRTGKLVRD